ncbi:MAG: ABC transporter permease [Thermoguttaceae bacterium]|nr:ABC transporter permease [Thermoguttaceae bacterium]
MSLARLIIASLVYHWRMHTAVGAGVAAATAVLTGALIVGDSMRGSLRDLTLERLGRVDEALVADRFFRADLAGELARRPKFKDFFAGAVPAVLLEASLENPSSEKRRRVNRVNLVGAGEEFWKLGHGGPKRQPQGREIVINAPLAEQLGVGMGDAVILRLPRITAIPAATPLGRKTETVAGHRLTVSEIVAAEGMGRFALRPDQRLPRNACVSLSWLQDRLEQPGRVNAILVSGSAADVDPQPEAHAALESLLKPTPVDLGLRMEAAKAGYFNITSQRMLIEPPLESALEKALEGADVQPAFTYLATAISRGEREVPYSTITAMDFAAAPPLGPMVTPEGEIIKPLEDNQIVLNAWAAERLRAKPGDAIRVSYFEPESADGKVREQTTEFQLAAVAAMNSAAADPELTPAVAGVTDQVSMADWDPPFPFDPKRIADEDEAYWDEHRAAPKAFVSLTTGRRLWGSRFGQTTSLRVKPGPRASLLRLQQLELPPGAAGLVFQPVKRQGLAASAGTTAFNGLFLGFSFFIIGSAVLLVTLLFRLGVEGRARQLGVLMALGFARPRVARLLLGEGLAVCLLAGLLGVGAGVGYAALMLAGLETLWLDAIVTPFLTLHTTVTSLAVGFVSGLAVSWLTIAWSVWKASRMSPRVLLGGRTADEPLADSRQRGWSGRVAVVLGAMAVLATLGATALDENLQAGAFFGAGALALAACLAAAGSRLRRAATGPAVAVGKGNLVRLAARNAARHPQRSTLTLGLVAAACFLIVAVSAFRLDPSANRPQYGSGNGGFRLLAESTQPIYYDMNTVEGRYDLAFSAADSRLLAEAKIFSLAVRPGDNASCLNLYQPQEPRILGVPEPLIRRGGFPLAAHWPLEAAERDEPWRLLDRKLAAEVGEARAPVFVDEATARYSLHLSLGDSLPVTGDGGERLNLVIVGLLKGSIFQGDVLMSESQFTEQFPDAAGRRYFLIEVPADAAGRVRDALERTLGDYGLAVESTAERMAALQAVQNTYLSTFQTLGGLGLLLGTFGLGAVELRSVLERRRELALLRATGFRKGLLARLVMLENAALLVTGLVLGVAAAALAVLPHWLSGRASVPWLWLAGILALVLTLGLAAGWLAVRAALAASPSEALRNE